MSWTLVQTGQMIELCSEYLSVRCIWLYVLVMSRTRFRVNPHSDEVQYFRLFLLFFNNCSDFVLIGVDLFKHWKQPPEVLSKKVFLEISQENTCARVSFSIKLQAESSTLLKKRIWDRCFPVYFAKYLGTLFYRTPPGDYFWSIRNSHLL